MDCKRGCLIKKSFSFLLEVEAYGFRRWKNEIREMENRMRNYYLVID